MVRWSSSWHPNGDAPLPASLMLRVLVVGDQLVAGVICDELLSAGHDSYPAHSGLSGLLKAVNRAPDVILIDLALPDMDGIDLANAVRSTEELEETVLIALSCHAREQVYWESRGVAIDHYLVKPIDLSQLAKLIQAAWESTREGPPNPACRHLIG